MRTIVQRSITAFATWTLIVGCTGIRAYADVPRAWENRAGIPPVGNQRVAGSCYAWAAAYYYLTHLQWRDYGWDVADPSHQCSPAFVYNLTNGGVDDGAWEGENARTDAFRTFETMRCATMADMPCTLRTGRSMSRSSQPGSECGIRTDTTRYSAWVSAAKAPTHS
jgi:hypothetical protein